MISYTVYCHIALLSTSVTSLRYLPVNLVSELKSTNLHVLIFCNIKDAGTKVIGSISATAVISPIALLPLVVS
jgi:hypothetical protein